MLKLSQSAVLILKIKLYVGHFIENEMRTKMMHCSSSLGIPAASCFFHSLQSCYQVKNNNYSFFFFYPFELILLGKTFRPFVESYLGRRSHLPDEIDWLDASWIPLTVLLLYFPRYFVRKGLCEVGKRIGKPLWRISVWNCLFFLKLMSLQLAVGMWVIPSVILWCVTTEWNNCERRHLILAGSNWEKKKKLLGDFLL